MQNGNELTFLPDLGVNGCVKPEAYKIHPELKAEARKLLTSMPMGSKRKLLHGRHHCTSAGKRSQVKRGADMKRGTVVFVVALNSQNMQKNIQHMQHMNRCRPSARRTSAQLKSLNCKHPHIKGPKGSNKGPYATHE